MHACMCLFVCVCVLEGEVGRGRVEGRHEASPEMGLPFKEQNIALKSCPAKNEDRISSLERVLISQRIDLQGLLHNW